MQVPVNGTTLYAEEAGHGPALLMVHGMCGDARVWADQTERLSDRYRCVSYDRRGHTRSPRTDVTETVQLHADDAAGLIGALGLAPCLLVGSSGGARIAVDVARRYPGLLAGAVFSEPPIGALAPEAFAAMIGEVGPAVQKAAGEGGPTAAVDAFFMAMCAGLWSAIDEATRDRYRANAGMLFADLGMPAYVVTVADLSEIRLPTLVITGTRSPSALQAAARVLAAGLPGARLVELDCGHVTYAEQPEAFAAAIATFAGEVWPETSQREAR
jgi:3-oxoadipate enol-lactonase